MAICGTSDPLVLRAIADTHALIWYLFDDPQLSITAGDLIDDATAAGDKVGFSSISLVETVYLAEKGRIDPDTLAQLLVAVDQPGSVFVEVPVHREVAEAMERAARTEIPDMPDRIIAATAIYLGVPVITRDRKIRRSAVPTIW